MARGEAIAAWNHRATLAPAAPVEMVERVARALATDRESHLTPDSLVYVGPLDPVMYWTLFKDDAEKAILAALDNPQGVGEPPPPPGTACVWPAGHD